MTLLSVENLTVAFPGSPTPSYVIQQLSFSVEQGEILGIVGESGCGKSLTALAILGLLPPQARIMGGRILWEGKDVLIMTHNERRKLRRTEQGIIFQNPTASLNPYMTIGSQMIEALVAFGNTPKKIARAYAEEMLERVHISDAKQRLRQYPHELSGGMCQRVMIAMALMMKPRLLIADEPTTALDVTIQAQILTLLSDLMRKTTQTMTMILISHDMGVIANMSDRILVMYGGTPMETGTPEALLTHPAHPYTAALLKSVPDLWHPSSLETIPGQPPLSHGLHTGCPFYPRCPYRQTDCTEKLPDIETLSHQSHRCIHPLHKEDGRKTT